MPLIPALGRQRQRQANLQVCGQPGLQTKFQDSQGYTHRETQSHKTKKERRGLRGAGERGGGGE